MFGLSGCHGLRTKMRWQELLYLRYPIQDESVSDIVTLDAQYWGWQAHLQILLDSLDLFAFGLQLCRVAMATVSGYVPAEHAVKSLQEDSRAPVFVLTCQVTSNRLSLTHFSTSYFHTLICIMEKQDISQR